MLVLIMLLCFCVLLCFVYLYLQIQTLQKDISDLYNLIYDKKYDFEMNEEEESGTVVRKCVESFRSFLGND